MFYILHGEDEFTRSQEIARLRARIAQEGLGDMNITVLDGQQLSLRELKEACNALPFLSDRRLVIVEDLLQRYEGAARPRRRRRTAAEASSADGEDEVGRLLAYLQRLPPTTRLIFAESKRLQKSNPILAAAPDIEGSYVREYRLPEGRQLQQWIVQRAHDKGVDISPRAVERLAALVGDNLRLLDAELEKLAAHAGYARSINERDVMALVAAGHESSIFDLVDALGLRRGDRAMQELHRLLEGGANELYILTMIARQVRLLLATKDLIEEQGLSPAQIGRPLGITHRFVIDKLVRQAKCFGGKELQALLRHIMEIDQAIKTGQIEGPLALEVLIAEVCSGEQPAAYQPRRRERTR